MVNGEEPVGKGLDIYGVNVILNEDLPQFISFILKYEKIWEIRKLIKLTVKQNLPVAKKAQTTPINL